MDKKQHEGDLKRKQEKHLENIQQLNDQLWSPCMHNQCPECIGTGIKKDGHRVFIL